MQDKPVALGWPRLEDSWARNTVLRAGFGITPIRPLIAFYRTWARTCRLKRSLTR